ncbi:response regulator transcription factor [Marisediminicola antarctica]|uniref:DNA-binding response regulator n=1 Tax=Marisediminicola antarctica TaxID=674079 RepID=A0A7L5AIW8_9MICO|nr:response regulator transcription factor [Marisediminicola antarctica]QHO70267.1 DNA-binding response regulator [Marisediminicola antarctica]
MTVEADARPEPIRVLLADDHPVVRHGLVALLGTLPGIEVVGQASSGAEAVRETALAKPDVVIMDLRMPDLSGVEATERILRHAPGVGVLVLTMFDEDEMIADALRAGARGYLLKGAEQEEIERAIRAVAAGEAIFSSTVAARVLGRLSSPAAVVLLPQITERERQVLTLIASGLDNTSISLRLNLAPKTVGNHISSIFLKLGVATRSQAIVLARESGLGGHD